jgi:hypothetical protein
MSNWASDLGRSVGMGAGPMNVLCRGTVGEAPLEHLDVLLTRWDCASPKDRPGE